MITHYTPLIKSGGGPSGYLYNLQTAIKECGEGRNVEIVTASETSESPASSQKERLVQRFLRKSRLLFNLHLKRTVSTLFERKDLKLYENLHHKTTIVFHGVGHAATYLNTLESSKPAKTSGADQVLAVMNHSPTLMVDELIEDYEIKYGQRCTAKVQSQLRFKELNIYSQIGRLVVPAISSLEGYQQFRPFSENLINGQIRLIEIPTGIRKIKPSEPRSIVRNRLGISDTTKTIGYFGRYNLHKGFDLFLAICGVLKHNNVSAVCAGTGPISPSREVVKDLGWTKDVTGLIGACDLVLQPNKVTYFDLLTLEALSIGTPVLISRTGGAKFFESRATPAVTLESSRDPTTWAKRTVQLLNAGTRPEAHLPTELSLEEFLKRHLALEIRIRTA